MIESERTLVHVQTRGRLTVPASLRRRLGLSKGAEVALEMTSRGVLIVPVTAPVSEQASQFARYRPEDDLLLGKSSPPSHSSSPGIVSMMRLGDALRARLRQPGPTAVAD